MKKPANPLFRLIYYAGNLLLVIPAVVLIIIGVRTTIRFGGRFLGSLFAAHPEDASGPMNVLPHVELSTVELVMAFILTWVGAIVCWAGISLGLRALANLGVTEGG